MLPFLKPDRIASTIVMHRNQKGETTATHNEDEAQPKHRQLAEKMLAAIKSGSADELSMHLEALLAPPPASPSNGDHT